MAPSSKFALVQTVTPTVGTGPITALPTSTLLGSLILCFVGASALTDTVSTVTDNAGNSYVKAYGVATGSGGDTELWYARNASSTSSIAVTFSAAVATKSVIVREYSGMDPGAVVLDRTATASGSGTSVTTGATSATQNANELVVCSCSLLAAASVSLAAGAGFGNFAQQTIVAGTATHGVEDLTVSTIGTQTGLQTASGTTPVWDVGVATFIQASGRLRGQFKVGTGMSRSEITP